MTTAVLFDIDGTLRDSIDLHAKAWQEAFQHFGHDISLNELRSQVGEGGYQLRSGATAPAGRPSQRGCRGGRRQSARCLGVLSGGFPESTLREAGCVAIYADVADLLRHYDESLLAVNR